MPKEDAALDYREPEWVAEKLGLDKNTVYKYLQEGWLPGVQLGRKWLISERLLAQHLESETRVQTETRRKVLPQTPRLSKVIQLASKYASGHGQDFIGTEHLLIGLAQERENMAVKIFESLDVDLNRPREMFETMVPALKGKAREGLPMTDRSRVALRFAQEQAIGLGHDYIGCEHLLLGLLLETTGIGFELLQSMGVTFEKVRAEIVKLARSRD
jgi:excisionase family DNA binding protein